MTVNELIAELQMLSAQGHGDVKIAVEMWDEQVISAAPVSPELIVDAITIVNSLLPPIKQTVVLIS